MKLLCAAVIAALSVAWSFSAIAATTTPRDPKHPAYVNQAPQKPSPKKVPANRHRPKKQATQHHWGFFTWST